MPTESFVREFPTKGDLLRGMSGSASFNVQPPKIIVANGLVFKKERNVAIRYLQNCGLVPIKVKIGDEAIGGADDFHFILAPGTATDDGLGSGIDVSKYIGAVWVKNDSGGGAVRVSAFIAYRIDGQPS